MSNRDGILDSHPSERVKMPPELAAFDRWDADPNDLAKWEAAMAAFAPPRPPEPTIPTPPSISKPASRSSCSKCS